MSSVSDELITQFITVTGTDDTSRATSYLEMSGGNLETAVSLYMEHSNVPPAGSSSHAPLSSGGAPSDLPPGFGPMNPDGVRAPDQTQTMRLMDFEDSHPAGNLLFPLHGNAPPTDQNPFYDARELVNAAAAGGGVDNDDEEEKEDATSSAAAMKTLNDMFAPPVHLMHRAGGFQGARNVAKDARRWLLVNLQRDDDFACHALNRDVWRDELVENLVREGFIFWQQMDNTPDGTTYAQRYNVQSFPHVAILDPRTGRLMWKKEGWTQVNPMTSEMFAQIAADFCSHHSFDKPPTAPRGSSSNATSTSTVRPKRPIHELSEEQQLQAAIQASMADNTDDESAGEMERTESEEGEDECDAMEPDVKWSGSSTTPSPPKTKTFDEEIREMGVPEEPGKGARVQIRFPDGSRVVRRFGEEELVKVIYAFVAQSNEDAKSGKSFEMKAGFPLKDLFSNINDTIKSCSLSGGSISIRWK